MSRRIREEMLAAGVAAENVAHIPHGVDTVRFHPPSAEERRAARARFGLPAEACVIAYTGRLLRGKGLEDLLAAFARVAADVPSAHLLIVGSGAGQALSVEEDLRARVARAGPGPARDLHRATRRRVGGAAGGGRVRLPVRLRGARPVAHRSGGDGAARGGRAHGRHRGRHRGRRVRLAGGARRRGRAGRAAARPRPRRRRARAPGRARTRDRREPLRRGDARSSATAPSWARSWAAAPPLSSPRGSPLPAVAHPHVRLPACASRSRAGRGTRAAA